MAATTTRRDADVIQLTADQQEGLLRTGAEPTLRGPEVIESGEGDDSYVTTRERPARLWMYSPEGVRKAIPGQDSAEAWRSGYRFTCPKCGTECGGILKDCPAVEAPAWMRCRVCGKILRDHQFADNLATPNPETPSGEEIVLPADTTPQARLRAKERRHMLARHPSEAPMYGHYPDPPRAGEAAR